MPLKPLAVAKSRLRGALPDLSHESLVLSLANATIAAALASDAVGRLIIISNDRWLGWETLPDCGGGLNAAIACAATRITGPVAAMPADLPALRPHELSDALGYAAVRSFVPDADGTGTVLLAAPSGGLLPCFGPLSARAHRLSGARELTKDWPTLRRDVDTAADLDAALRLGWQSSGLTKRKTKPAAAPPANVATT